MIETFYGGISFNFCTNFVEVPIPFGSLPKIMDLDICLGPHLDAFDILPNFGMGEIF